MELTSVALHARAFWRLVGTDSDDPELARGGESAGEVLYSYLTRGSRRAQRFMLKNGYGGWRKRSVALVWSGTDAADGGRYSALPADFLRAFGNGRMSALVEANGDRWGSEVTADEDTKRGNGYFIRDVAQVRLLRGALPPATIYLDYHFKHPVWTAVLADADIDFPIDARALIIANAADVAKNENWLPGDQSLEVKIDQALKAAQSEAMDLCRTTKQPRQLKRPVRHGNHW